MAAVMKVSLSRLSRPLVRQRKIARKEGRMDGGEPETALQAIGDSDFEALSNGQIALSSLPLLLLLKAAEKSNRQRSFGVGARETPDPTSLLTMKCFASEIFH